jgi:hypothetical protein
MGATATSATTEHSRPAVPGDGDVQFGSGRVTAAAVEQAEPLVLMSAVAGLTRPQVESLSAGEAEAYVIACERVTAAVHARQSLAMDTLAVRVDEEVQHRLEQRPLPSGVPSPDVHSTVASMLAPALGCSTRTVARRLEADRWLVCTAESTFAAHWRGELGRARADAVVEAGRDLDADLRPAFEALVLGTRIDEVTGEVTLVSADVRRLSRAQLARRAAAVARSVDPESHTRAARRARDDRRVVVTPDRRRPGMSRWDVLLPSEVSQQVFAAVDGLASQYARSCPGTPVDAQRADALIDLVLGNADVRTTVELLVPVLPDARCTGDAPVEERTRDHEQAGIPWRAPAPVEVPRHGELLPSAVVALLSRPETLIRLARLDPDGSIVQDPRAYRPSQSLRRHVQARDGTCRFPGCRTPARRCDVDHVVPHPVGPTDQRNLLSLCRTHHRFKHHGDWSAVLHEDGTATWTSPDGRPYRTRPQPWELTEPLGPIDSADAEMAHELRRGWFPGLPVGMPLADLVLAEAALPEEPPEPEHTPAPPPDWQELDWQQLDCLAVTARAPTWNAAAGDGLDDLSPMERHLAGLLALAA